MNIEVGDVLLLDNPTRHIFATAVQAAAGPAPGAGTWKCYVRGVVLLNFLRGETPRARRPPDAVPPRDRGQAWKYVSYDVEYDPEPVYALTYMRARDG